MYYYFVSFSHDHGFAHAQISRNIPIEKIEDINKISEDIEKSDPKLSNVIILNFQLLRKEPATKKHRR